MGEEQEYKTGKGGQAASKGYYSVRNHGGSLELGKFWNLGETCFKSILQEGPGEGKFCRKCQQSLVEGFQGRAVVNKRDKFPIISEQTSVLVAKQPFVVVQSLSPVLLFETP